jgi:ECF transporter S component (folate family)
LVFGGILIATSIVLTRFASIRVNFGAVEGIRIGFGTFPIIFAGFCFGPLMGALVGALSDILGYILSPAGPYMPHFTLSAALYGIIPGLFAMASFLSERSRILGGVLVSQLSVGLLLTPFFLATLFGIPWKFLIIPRLVGTPVQIVAYFYIFQILRKSSFANKLLFQGCAR